MYSGLLEAAEPTTDFGSLALSNKFSARHSRVQGFEILCKIGLYFAIFVQNSQMQNICLLIPPGTESLPATTMVILEPS